jgi:hypothetical protein
MDPLPNGICGSCRFYAEQFSACEWAKHLTHRPMWLREIYPVGVLERDCATWEPTTELTPLRIKMIKYSTDQCAKPK